MTQTETRITFDIQRQRHTAFGPTYRRIVRIERLDTDTPTIAVWDRHRDENGTPMDEWAGRVPSFRADGWTRHDLEGFFRQEHVRDLIARMAEGFSVEWNGNDWRGRMTEDAESAKWALNEALYNERRV